MARAESVELAIAGREVKVSNPGKVFFEKLGVTKLELVNYYVAVADGALRGAGGRPMALKRFVNGAAGEFFFQKRAPESRPEWVETVVLAFPSGRTAEEIVLRDAAQLAWIVNLGCIDLNPHPVRADDLEHPDELRIDLDPCPGVEWPQIRDVALVAKESLEAHGLIGFPKTSGSRGIHINVRVEKKWTFSEVRRAALALARDVERRAPKLATSKWWKEERHGVFLDYNQNAKDRTVASAYSVRPTPDARVSAPLTWDELPACEPADFTIRTMLARYEKIGDPHASIDDHPGSLEAILERAAKDEADGSGDAPWPPQYAKQPGEPKRVQPSRARVPKGETDTSAPTGRRKSTMPLLVISRAEKKEDALAGFERWKAKYPEVAKQLAVDDVLVDPMRGRSTTWTRIRVNLRHIPEAERPAQEPPDPDYDVREQWMREKKPRVAKKKSDA
jgi:bifunctional non-homologous end joining protein LigD